MNINFRSATCHTEESSVAASDIAFILIMAIAKVKLGIFLSLDVHIPSFLVKAQICYIFELAELSQLSEAVVH